MGTFVISCRLNGKFKFAFISRKGTEVLVSEGYAEKEDCEKAILLLKEYVGSMDLTRHKTAGGKLFFRVLLNQMQIAQSRRYTSEFGMQKGIEEVQTHIANAEVLDFAGAEGLFDSL